MRYPLAISSWDQEEINAAKAVLDSKRYTMGAKTREFELAFADKVKTKYAVMCNSGSSANLLAVSALLYRQQGPQLQPGDEVIVPAVSWATTYTPLHQCGLKLVFVDVNQTDFNIAVDKVQQAITSRTKAVFAVNLLGMPCDFARLSELCDRHGLLLLEDNCESLGCYYDNQSGGTFGLLGTYSTFFSHHLCTIEGGVVVTDDEELYHILISLRSHGWLRDLPLENHVHNKSGDLFTDSFKFVLPGYNLRPNDLYAAIGLQQLKKYDTLMSNRRINAVYLHEKLQQASCEFLTIQRPIVNAQNSSWFGFGFLCEHRNAIVDYLAEHQIESRPIVAGNFTKNPVIDWFDCDVGDYPVADMIDQQGFFIGNNGADLTAEIDYFCEVVKGYNNVG